MERYKNVFGYEDAATESAQRRFDLFGYNDAKNVEAYKKSSQLFGTEDLQFQTGQRGRDLFGNDDASSEDAQMTRQILALKMLTVSAVRRVGIFSVTTEKKERKYLKLK